MKRFSFFPLTLLVLTLIGYLGIGECFAWTGVIVGDGGVILHTYGLSAWFAQTSGTTNNLHDVAFADTLKAWAVGDGGVIRYTTNSGTNWTAQVSGTTNNLWGVCFVDPYTGWIVGDGGIIRRTTNGGSTWTTQTSGTSFRLYKVTFKDPNNGWAVGDAGVILFTPNGGGLWILQSSGTTQSLQGVSFLNLNTGMVVGGGSTVLRTTDGGTTWTLCSQPPDDGTVRGVSLMNVNTAWISGYRGGWGGRVWNTTNGGSTWVLQRDLGGNYSEGICFIDSLRGWAVGDGGSIFRTTTGDSVWSSQPSGTSNTLWSVAFTNRAPSGVEENRVQGFEGSRVQGVKVNPNPFTSFASIPGHERERFALYDISGRKVGVYRGDRIGEGLKAGVYFLDQEGKRNKPLRIVKLH